MTGCKGGCREMRETRERWWGLDRMVAVKMARTVKFLNIFQRNSSRGEKKKSQGLQEGFGLAQLEKETGEKGEKWGVWAILSRRVVELTNPPQRKKDAIRGHYLLHLEHRQGLFLGFQVSSARNSPLLFRCPVCDAEKSILGLELHWPVCSPSLYTSCCAALAKCLSLSQSVFSPMCYSRSASCHLGTKTPSPSRSEPQTWWPWGPQHPRWSPIILENVQDKAASYMSWDRAIPSPHPHSSSGSFSPFPAGCDLPNLQGCVLGARGIFCSPGPTVGLFFASTASSNCAPNPMHTKVSLTFSKIYFLCV